MATRMNHFVLKFVFCGGHDLGTQMRGPSVFAPFGVPPFQNPGSTTGLCSTHKDTPNI